MPNSKPLAAAMLRRAVSGVAVASTPAKTAEDAKAAIAVLRLTLTVTAPAPACMLVLIVVLTLVVLPVGVGKPSPAYLSIMRSAAVNLQGSVLPSPAGVA